MMNNRMSTHLRVDSQTPLMNVVSSELKGSQWKKIPDTAAQEKMRTVYNAGN